MESYYHPRMKILQKGEEILQGVDEEDSQFDSDNSNGGSLSDEDKDRIALDGMSPSTVSQPHQTRSKKRWTGRGTKASILAPIPSGKRDDSLFYTRGRWDRYRYRWTWYDRTSKDTKHSRRGIPKGMCP